MEVASHFILVALLLLLFENIFKLLKLWSEVKKLQKLSILKISPWPKIDYCLWKECKCLKVQEYLEVNIMHLHQNSFSCTNFCKCTGLDILCGFFFENEKDFTSKYTEQSGTIFRFCVSFVTCFCEKFKK